MLQIVMNPGEDEEISDLADAPEIILVQFCTMILKHQDLRDPDVQKSLRELLDAMKARADTEPVGPGCYDRRYLKEDIARIEDLLDSLSES